MKNEHQPIQITGTQRSGLSMIAGILDVCGAQGGELIGGNCNTKEGVFENREIISGVVAPLMELNELNTDYLEFMPKVLPEIKTTDHLTQSLFSTVKQQHLTSHCWYIKSHKLCWLWPFFHKMFPKGKWVLVRRCEKQIIHSCLCTGYMKAYSEASDWKEWVERFTLRFSEMKLSLNVFEVWPGKIFEDDLTELQELVEWCGLEWNESLVRAFLKQEK